MLSLPRVADDRSDGGCLGLTYTQRLTGFALCLGSGMLCLLLASVQLFAIVLAPHKFALMYTLANVLLLGSSVFLVGPVQQMKHMCAEHRAPASIAYLVSLLLTLYLALSHPSILLMLPMMAVQVIAFGWYIGTYIPFRGYLSGFMPV